MTVSIINLIIDSVTNALVETLQSELGTDDETRAYLVRPGLLQADPTHGINVLIHENDPDSPKDWQHVITANSNDLHTQLGNWSWSIDGAELWFRRFTVELIMFWKPKHTREQARNLSNVVLSRAERTIKTFDVGLGPDDFGEQSIHTYRAASWLEEGGGTGQFIWRGYIRFQVLTGQDGY